MSNPVSDTTANAMDQWPVGTWVPHQRDTWPFWFATVKEPTEFREWDGSRDARGGPAFTYRTIPAGTKVKIVMVSRFGDVGITDDLDAETGYRARVYLDALKAEN